MNSPEMPLVDPSVIVGVACRVPGATNTHALWEMLKTRQDVQKQMPKDRYNAEAFYHPAGTNKGTVSIFGSLFCTSLIFLEQCQIGLLS